MIFRCLAPVYKEGSGVALCGVKKVVKNNCFANIKKRKVNNFPAAPSCTLHGNS